MKYIVKQCPLYLIGMCHGNAQQCAEITNCTIKNAILECLEYSDNGRIELINNSKNLTERGRLAKKIIQIFEAEEVKGE